MDLCKSMFDFEGEGPGVFCDLPSGHGGDWHEEKWVARWSLDWETFQWWSWDTWLDKGHWED